MDPLRDVSTKTSRRGFLRTATHGVAAGFAFPTIVPGSALGLGARSRPSNRITLGVIGTGNQGFNDIRSFLKDERVQIVAVCDVNRESPGYWDGKVGGREPARRLVEEHYAQAQAVRRRTAAATPTSTSARSSGRKDIDAVEVCTPGPLARHPGHRGLQGAARTSTARSRCR